MKATAIRLFGHLAVIAGFSASCVVAGRVIGKVAAKGSDYVETLARRAETSIKEPADTTNVEQFPQAA